MSWQNNRLAWGTRTDYHWRPMDPRSDTFVFVHIGKTAGTAVRSAITGQFPSDLVCPKVFYEDIYALPIEELSRYRLFCAHIGFDTAHQLGEHLFTVMRDPVDRVLSLYRYWRKVEGHGSGPELAKTRSLDAFLEEKSGAVIADIHNTQTWQLAFAHDGPTRKLVSQTHSLDEVYQRAVANLKILDAVGIQENLPAFMDELEHLYGWQLPPLGQVNVTGGRNRRDDLPLATRRKIHGLVEADIELYAHVLASRTPGRGQSR